jgi:hypothetical protein
MEVEVYPLANQVVEDPYPKRIFLFHTKHWTFFFYRIHDLFAMIAMICFCKCNGFSITEKEKSKNYLSDYFQHHIIYKKNLYINTSLFVSGKQYSFLKIYKNWAKSLPKRKIAKIPPTNFSCNIDFALQTLFLKKLAAIRLSFFR